MILVEVGMRLKSQESSLLIHGDYTQGILHMYWGTNAARGDSDRSVGQHQAWYILKRMLADEVT